MLKAFPNERCGEIIKILLNTKDSITVDEIANKLTVSNRTIRNDLQIIEEYLKDNCLGKLIKKPRVGIWIETSKEKEEILRNELNKRKKYIRPFSSEERQLYIIKRLLKSNTSITMQQLSNELYVSRITIYKDLENVEEWLHKYRLNVIRKQNYGIEVNGKEIDWRKALWEFLITLEKYREENKIILNPDYNYRKHCKSNRHNQIKDLFDYVDLDKIVSILNKAEKNLNFLLTDEAFDELLIHLAISVDRLITGNMVTINSEELKYLKKVREYKIACGIYDIIKHEYKITVTDDEIGYITYHLLGSKRQQNYKEQGMEQVLENIDKDIVDFTKEVISLIGNILSVDFSKDKNLLTGLALHLKPTINRFKYGLDVNNPLLNDIKINYPSVFGASWATSVLFEKYYGIKISEDEIGFIAIHIGAALERQKTKTRVIIVCNSGIGTAQLVAIRLKKSVYDLEIVNVYSSHDLERVNDNDFDFIISTVPIEYKLKPVLQINPIVRQEDIERIKKYISNIENTKKFSKEIFENRINDLFSTKLIFPRLEVSSKEEIIKFLGDNLIREGYIEPDFIDTAIERENITSTAVGKGVAIPHGNEEYVKKPCIAVATLNKPINWSENMVDIVFLLALNFNSSNFIKTFFKKFYSILNNEYFLNDIRHCDNSAEIFNILTKK